MPVNYSSDFEIFPGSKTEPVDYSPDLNFFASTTNFSDPYPKNGTGKDAHLGGADTGGRALYLGTLSTKSEIPDQ